MDATTFDLFDFMSGATYPEDDIRVYTDKASVYTLAKIEKLIADEKDSERANELDAQAAELREKISATSLVFHFKGLPTAIAESVDTKLDAKYGIGVVSDERYEDRMHELIALHITGVERADGAKDSRTWDADTVKRLLGTLEVTQANKLLNGVMELTLRARQFEDYEVTPDFS